MAADGDPRTRAETYNLLSKLALHGLTEASLVQVQAIPALAGALPGAYDADEAAADHYQLFGFNVFPYQSIFLDPSGLMGGTVTGEVLHSYRDAGFALDVDAESPDHLGHELGFLAFLGRQEAGAAGRGSSDQARQFAHLQRQFLDAHLLRWLLPVTQAIGRQGHPFYAAVAGLILELVLDHWRAGEQGQNDGTKNAFPLPEPPDLLAEEHTGLKEIADYLLTPVYSGIYLSRDEITRLARGRSLPHGFGDRRTLLLNLFRSAAHYGEVESILAALQTLVDSWVQGYEEWAGRFHPLDYAEQWTARAQRTGEMFGRMHAFADLLPAVHHEHPGL